MLKIVVVTLLGLLIKYQSPAGTGNHTGPSLLFTSVSKGAEMQLNLLVPVVFFGEHDPFIPSCLPWAGGHCVPAVFEGTKSLH